MADIRARVMKLAAEMCEVYTDETRTMATELDSSKRLVGSYAQHIGDAERRVKRLRERAEGAEYLIGLALKVHAKVDTRDGPVCAHCWPKAWGEHSVPWPCQTVLALGVVK